MKFEAPRGTQDVLPAQQPLWQRVIRETEVVCGAYGYRRITTPLFEDTELFTRTSGEGSDVVQKEMYTFTDRGERSLTLRPEGTASVARAYVEHGLYREPQPVKTFSFDFSFNSYPLSFDRPGPEIVIYRLQGGECGGR